jgi:hypothetical protein
MDTYACDSCFGTTGVLDGLTDEEIQASSFLRKVRFAKNGQNEEGQ